jgi:hypothetical protein
MSAPAASSAPPAVSAIPAARAFRRAGRNSRLSIMPVVLSMPGPPNQPNSFWVPWPTNSGPTTPRSASLPKFIASSRCACLRVQPLVCAQRAAPKHASGRSVTMAVMSPTDDEDDWVGTPPEGRYTRDRAKPEFWWRQKPIVPAFVGIVVVVVVILIVVLLG